MNFLQHLGRYFFLLRAMIARPEKPSMYWKETMRQMNDIGVGSILIVTLIAVFMGAVTSVQYIYQLKGLPIPLYWVGYVLRESILLELAPTVSCLVLAGKVGSNIASEIGGMRQKEQIDALEVMGINTAAYLVMPKVIAALIVIPLIVILAAYIGIAGGLVASVQTGHLSQAEFMIGARVYFTPVSVRMMLIKAFVFAFILTTISSYQGYFVKGGSVELGEASTRAVVFSNIAILLADYVIAFLLT